MIDQDDHAMRFSVREADVGRIDKVLAARFPGVGRRAISELFRRGAVRLNGRRARKGAYAEAGAEIELAEVPRDARSVVPEAMADIDLHVLYQDDALVALNKPGAMASHPLRPDERDTLANALLARFPECAHAGADAREAGLAHRLDPGTSGVIIAARNRDAWQSLRRAFGSGQAVKLYWALVAGTGALADRCDLPLINRGKRAVVARDGDDAALAAWTRWRPVARHTGYTLMGCITRTGRRHQVRVHLAEFGLPIVGDKLYGGPPAPLGGHFLHARSVTLPHPITGKRLHIRAPLPANRQGFLDALDSGLGPTLAP